MHFRRKMLALALMATASLVGVSTSAAADGEGGRIELVGLQRIIDTRGGSPTTMVALPVGMEGLVTVTVLPTVAGDGWVTVRPCGAAPSATDRRVPYEHEATSIQVVAEANTCAYASTSADFIVDREAGLRSSPNPEATQYGRSAFHGGVMVGSSDQFGRPA